MASATWEVARLPDGAPDAVAACLMACLMAGLMAGLMACLMAGPLPWGPSALGRVELARADRRTFRRTFRRILRRSMAECRRYLPRADL